MLCVLLSLCVMYVFVCCVVNFCRMAEPDVQNHNNSSSGELSHNIRALFPVLRFHRFIGCGLYYSETLLGFSRDQKINFLCGKTLYTGFKECRFYFSF